MKENLHPIDQLFKNGLNKHQENPPESSWETISNKLDKEKVIYFGKKYQEFKKIAIALFFLGSIATVYALYLKKEETKRAAIQNSRFKDNNLSKNTKEFAPDSNTISPEEPSMPEISTQIKTPDNSNNTQKLATSPKTPGNKFSTIIKTQNSIYTGKNSSIVLEGTGTMIHNPKSNITINQANLNKKESKYVGDEKENALTVSHNTKNRNQKHSADLLYYGINNNSQINKELYYIAHDNVQAPGLEQLFKNNSEKFNTIRNNIPSLAAHKPTALKSAQKNSMSLTAFYSADNVSNHLNDDNSPGRRDKHDFENTEHNSSSYSTGFLLDVNLSKTLSLGSGIIYSTTSTTIFPKTIYARPDNRGNIKYQFNCSSGYSYLTSKTTSNPSAGDSINALSSKTKIEYLTLPVNLKYHFNFDRFSVNPAVGVYVNYLIKGSMATTIVNNNNKETIGGNTINGLKSAYVNGFLGLEVAYSLNRNLSLMVSPNERMALSAINKDTPVKTYPSIFGIYAGVKMNF